MAVKNICQIVFIFSAVVLMAQVIAETNTNANLNTNANRNTNAKSPERDGCTGCPIELDPNDEKVKLYIDKAYKKFTMKYPGNNSPIVVDIPHASQQVVAGVQYLITVNIGPSNCTKSPEPPKNCILLESSQISKCIITAYVRSWENFEKVDISCEGLTAALGNSN